MGSVPGGVVVSKHPISKQNLIDYGRQKACTL